MSAETPDGTTVDGINKTNGDTEDTIPLKDAEKNETSSATIEINDQSTNKEKRNKFMGKMATGFCELICLIILF